MLGAAGYAVRGRVCSGSSIVLRKAVCAMMRKEAKGVSRGRAGGVWRVIYNVGVKPMLKENNCVPRGKCILWEVERFFDGLVSE